MPIKFEDFLKTLPPKEQQAIEARGTELKEEEMRRRAAVAVCRDLLFQMGREDNPIVPQRGTYLEVRHNSDSPLAGYEGELQNVVDEFQNNDCQACALGSMLLCTARLFDNARIWAMTRVCGHRSSTCVPYDQIIEGLRNVFDRNTIDVIESAFECRPCHGNEPEHYGAAVFGTQFVSATEALRAICENIIANDGDFIVADSDWYGFIEAKKKWYGLVDDKV